MIGIFQKANLVEHYLMLITVSFDEILFKNMLFEET